MEMISAEKQARSAMQYRLNVQAVDIGKGDPRFHYVRGLLPGDLYSNSLLRAPGSPQKVERRYDHFLVAEA